MALQELSRRLAIVTTLVDEIMQQEIRPLVAVDIIEQLHRQFAILSGGRGKDGAPIITFPAFVGFKHIADEDFLNVMTYLTSIPSVEAASIGFIIVIDRRRDKWSSIKASLTRISVAFPGNLKLMIILRPSCFIQRTFTDIGIKHYRDEFKKKVPIIMLNSVSDLHGYIDKSQLTEDLGGTLEYRHSQWINHRTAIENFALTLKTTAQMLQTFGTFLAATELPKNLPSTEELLMSYMRQRDKLQEELKLLGKQGATLLSCIQEPATKNPTSKLNPNELENVATMERLFIQLDETGRAFSQFWSEHLLQLNQYLQLQHFEHNFCEVKLALDGLLAEQAEFTDLGDSVICVEQLLKEHKKLEGKGQEPLEKAQLLAVTGEQLVQSHHSAVDSIRPRCVELRHLCDDFINENKKKCDILGKSLELHRRLDKVSQWCEAGIYLLASQAVDKCQSREGVDIALHDIEAFLGTAEEYQLSSSKEFYNQFELMLPLDVKAKAQKVLQKLGDVQEIFHKRQMSLMKLAARQTRPVQPVAPHPESSPKWVSPKTSQPSALAPLQKTSEETYAETDLNSLEKENDETKSEVKNEKILESHHDGETPELKQLDSPENLSSRRRIICDLLETEDSYIKEIKSIIDGYITPMDFIWLKHLIPDVLQNNKDFLFGNIRELYEFHSRTFLKELEKCTENTELLARCFLKRKEDLQIYFKYHKNLPRARAIWQECQDCAYFGVCQRQLDHKLPLFKYLRGPSHRLTQYQMLLKGLLDFESCEDLEIGPGDLEGGSIKNGPQRTKDSVLLAEIQQALTVLEDLIQSCELAVDLAAVTECPDDIGKLGKLLMHESFNVWTVHKDRHKMKDFIRFKPSQRQIYLFERGIVFCKIRMETSYQGLSPQYSFKKSIKLMTLSIRQLGRGSNRKFEIANQNGLEKYILQAASKEIRDCWFSEISKLLMEQQNSTKGRSGRESISTDTAEDREGAEQMEKESSAPSVTHFLLPSVLSPSVPCLPFRPPALLSLILTHQDQAYPGELRSPELQSGSDPSGPAQLALPSVSSAMGSCWDPGSRDFSSWTTVVKPVPPNVFWTRENTCGGRKAASRRARECERAKESGFVSPCSSVSLEFQDNEQNQGERWGVRWLPRPCRGDDWSPGQSGADGGLPPGRTDSLPRPPRPPGSTSRPRPLSPRGDAAVGAEAGPSLQPTEGPRGPRTVRRGRCALPEAAEPGPAGLSPEFLSVGTLTLGAVCVSVWGAGVGKVCPAPRRRFSAVLLASAH